MIKIDVVMDCGCSTISCNKYSNKLWNLCCIPTYDSNL